MPHPLQHWLDLWAYLDQNFWGLCRWFERELTPEQIGWQPIPQVASIGWNLRHLGEMLDHYLTFVFQAQPKTVALTPLVTMERDSQDDGRFRDLAAIQSYHHVLRPAYRHFLEGLTPALLDASLSPRPNARPVAWAVGHIAEHESYHLGKCTLLRKLVLSQ